MAYTLERPERKGDRSRSRISTPSEVVAPTFVDGMIRVVCQKASARDVLVRRHGFAEVSSAPAPVAPSKPVEVEVEVEVEEDPASLSYRERVSLAKSLGIEGASRMKSADLLDAILAALD